MSSSAPIGVFDSGIGGLTVVAAIRRELPSETIVYLGDTARVPYGTKSPEVVRRYALRCSRLLVEQGAKMIVIACNTATAHGLDAMRRELRLPILGVIEPGAKLAATRTRGGRIGVIGTEGTITSGSYQQALARSAPHAQVVAQACPLFVPLAEEGLGEHPAARLIAEDYLRPLLQTHIDTLVLGCTHYPLLERTIRGVLGPEVDVVDSATAVASAVRAMLEEHEMISRRREGGDRFFATDTGPRFQRVGRAFLGDLISEVEVVDL